METPAAEVPPDWPHDPIASGLPADVAKADILSDVYDVKIDLIQTPDEPMPLIRAR